MKKFEEEFDNLIRAFVEYRDCFDFDTEKYYLELKKEFIEKYGKKQQPEIPEFVAAEIEGKNHIYGDFRRIANITHYSEDVRHWYYAKPYHAELFYRAILDGYTVAKEKRYVVEFLSDNYDRYILMQQGDEQPIIDIESNNDGFFKQEFTEQEIKDINEQYWAFAELVEEEE